MNDTKDDTWYVAIMEFYGKRHYSFVGAHGESYRDFSETARLNGIEIIAEQFEITDVVINKLTGFDEHGRSTGKNLLKELVDKLNAGEELNARKVLERLCKEV